jgi:hypothetical protein
MAQSDLGYPVVSRIWEQWDRLWPAVVTVCLPYLFVFLIYEPSVAHLLKTPDWTALRQIEISQAALDRFAQNIQGIFLFGIGSGFLRATAVAAIVLAATALARNLGIKTGLSVVAAILALSLGAFTYGYKTSVSVPDAHGPLGGFIRPVLHVVFAAAAERGVVLDTSAADVDLAILLNLLALTAGFNSLLATFAAIAVRALPGDLTPSRLRERGHALQWSAIATAALLVFVTAVNKALIVWPQGLMTPESQKSYGYIAGAIATYWGAYGSGVLICALLPAYVSLRVDITSAARAAAGDSLKAQDDWQKENAMNFDVKSGVFAAITASAPVLTGPGIDLFGRLLG